MSDNIDKVYFSDDEWKQKLSEKAYHICRQKGTEPPFSGQYGKHKESGIYTCIACSQDLFSSKTKFDSHSGWPSFYAPIAETALSYREDPSLARARVEVLCSRCDSHLGHLFNDGPNPTGKRYCINSGSLSFKKQ